MEHKIKLDEERRLGTMKKKLYRKYIRTLRGHFPSSALAWRLSFILSFAASNKSINFTVSEDLIEGSRNVKDRSGEKEEKERIKKRRSEKRKGKK